MSSAEPALDGESALHIVHEMNQPLAAVLIDAEAALRWLGRDSADLAEARQSIERVIGNCRRIVDAVRDVRRLVQSPPAAARLDLNSTVQTLLELVRGDLEHRGIAVETELAAPLEPIRGDRGQLERVLANLIANGVEAMSVVQDRQRRLRISSRLDSHGDVLVAVEDSGTGMDPASLERVFEPYYTTKCQGRGLGLAMCRSIIESHGGRLWALPNRPYGSVFSFTIPKSSSGVKRPAISAAEIVRSDHDRESIDARQLRLLHGFGGAPGTGVTSAGG
jgi:signal transduction histidine kinase